MVIARKSSFHLRTLGLPELALDGAPVPLSAKALALLVYLRWHAPHPVHREALVALLWPPRETGAPKDELRRRQTSLRMALSELRHAGDSGRPLVEFPSRTTVSGSLDLPCDAPGCAGAVFDGEITAGTENRGRRFLDGWPEAAREHSYAAWVAAVRAMSQDSPSAVSSRVSTPAALPVAPVPSNASVIANTPLTARSARRGGLIGSAAAAVGLLLVAFGTRLHPGTPGRAGLVEAATTISPVCRDGNGRATLVDEVWRVGTIMEPGRLFTRAWTLENTGTCSWSADFLIRFVRHTGGGRALSETQVDRRLGVSVAPRERTTIRILMRSSPMPGRTSEEWHLLDATGRPIRIDDTEALPTSIITREPHVRACAPGEGSGELTASNHLADEIVTASARDELSWSLKNAGTCSWAAGVRARRVTASGHGTLTVDSTSAPSMEVIPPGDRLTIRIPMRLPLPAGRFEEAWEVVDRAGRRLSTDHSGLLRASLVVPSSAEQPSAAAEDCAPGEERAGFVSETIPDDRELNRGETFTKVWTLFNRGHCRWSASTSLVFLRASRVRMSVDTIVAPTRPVLPGTTVSFALHMRAPTVPGNHREIWQLRSHAGRLIPVSSSDSVWVAIVVR